MKEKTNFKFNIFHVKITSANFVGKKNKTGTLERNECHKKFNMKKRLEKNI